LLKGISFKINRTRAGIQNTDTSRSRGSPKQLRRLHLKGRAALDTHSPPLNPTTTVKVFNTRLPCVRVRVREVDAAPRCAGRPRIAGSAFERVGLERARSRERPDDLIDLWPRRGYIAQLQRFWLLDSETPYAGGRHDRHLRGGRARDTRDRGCYKRDYARRVERFNSRIACLDRLFSSYQTDGSNLKLIKQ
jgi:hypothetical protein